MGSTVDTGIVADDAATSAHDLILSFDVLHDSTDPAAFLRSIRRALAPDGRYLLALYELRPV